MNKVLFGALATALALAATFAQAADNRRAAVRHARQAAREAGIVENQLNAKLGRGNRMAAEAEIVQTLAESLESDLQHNVPFVAVAGKYRVMSQHAAVILQFLAHVDLDRDHRLQNQARLMNDDIVTVGELIGVSPDRVVVGGVR